MASATRVNALSTISDMSPRHNFGGDALGGKNDVDDDGDGEDDATHRFRGLRCGVR
jgi:hypothetical protein